MGNAMVPMVSAVYGCSDKSKMRDAYVYTLKVVLACSTTLRVLMFIFTNSLMSLLIYNDGCSS